MVPFALDATAREARPVSLSTPRFEELVPLFLNFLVACGLVEASSNVSVKEQHQLDMDLESQIKNLNPSLT